MQRISVNNFAVLALAVLVAALAMFALAGTASAAGGFDKYGYNDTARIFNGLADGLDRNLDGTYYGNTTYAKDKIVMKWNAERDRGNDENWSNPPYSAWIDNEWNGKKGGSGSVWHYKIAWVGSCGADGTPLPDGGYCIWGQFETLMDQGTDAGAHYWFAKATPNGYGSK